MIDLNTEELVAKRANQNRIKEFSKNLKEFNKNMIQKESQDDLNQNNQQQQQQQQKKEESKKEKSLQYAQNIPKPKVKPESKQSNANEGKNIGMISEAIEVSKLDELTSKHLQNKKQVEAIKKSLGL